MPSAARRRMAAVSMLGAAALAGPFWLGMLVTAATGLAAIRLLLAYLRERGVGVFAVYRVLLAVFCACWALR